MLLRDLLKVRKRLGLASDEQAGLQDFNKAHKKLNQIREDFLELHNRTQARGLIATAATANITTIIVLLRSFRPRYLILDEGLATDRSGSRGSL